MVVPRKKRLLKEGDIVSAAFLNALQDRLIALEQTQTYGQWEPPAPPEIGFAICIPTQEKRFRACRLEYVPAVLNEQGGYDAADRRGHWKDGDYSVKSFDLSFALFDDGDNAEEDGSEDAPPRTYQPLPGEIYAYVPHPPGILVALPTCVARSCRLKTDLNPGSTATAEVDVTWYSDDEESSDGLSSENARVEFAVSDSDDYPLMGDPIKKNRNIKVVFNLKRKRFEIHAAGCQ
jgi:hypothetical protein